MKKSLLAIAAMTAFAGAAQAQSSVSVYGIYDGSFADKQTTETSAAGVKQKTQGSGFTGSSSASSRLGFKGNEQISGDLSTNFNLEIGITEGTGTIGTTTDVTGTAQGGSPVAATQTSVRTSIVGLESKQFGRLDLGRQLTGIHAIVAGDVWGGNNMGGDMTYTDFNTTSTNAQTGRVHGAVTRSNNMASYTSPTISGFNLRADYGNTNATTLDQPGVTYSLKGLNASYTWGPIVVKAGQTVARSNEALALNAAFAGLSTTVNAANIAYKGIQNLLVQYTYAGNKVEAIGAAPMTNSKVRAQKLSASYQMGAIMPFIQYGVGGTQGLMQLGNANTTTTDKALQLGTEYALSKRSYLYAAYGMQERAAIAGSAKTELNQVAAGLRHTF